MAIELLLPGENCMLYGPTGGGKTTQLRKLIEAMATKDRPARVYAAREPSTLTILSPCVRAGICQIVYHNPQQDPFMWIDNAMQGMLPGDGENWVQGEPQNLSLIVFEGASSMSDLAMAGLGKQAAEGNNVGGEPAPALKIQSGGKTLMVESNSRSHYLVAQKFMLKRVWVAQTLPCPQVWTAHEDIVGLDKKTNDGTQREIAASLGIRGVIGPQLAGSALTAGLPKYFVFTFRLTAIPAEQSKKHVLYTGRHKDGDLEGIANARVDLPVRYEPADIVKVLTEIRGKLK